MRFFILFFFSSLCVFAQSGLSTKSNKAIALYMEADNYRVHLDYDHAIELLNEAIKKDKNFEEAYYRRGLIYEAMDNYQMAIPDYEKALALTHDLRKQKSYLFSLGVVYFATGRYDDATRVLNEFKRAETQDQNRLAQADRLLRNIAFAASIKDADTNYKVHLLSDTVNHFYMQYFPVLTADQQNLIFTRRLGAGPTDDEDLVISSKDEAGHWRVPVSLSDNINTQLNEGTCTISADGRELIFTSCIGREGYGSCDLFESRKTGEVWSVPKNLGPNVNSGAWESQPSLSADGRTLYFVSDRHGGVGGRDIWMSELNDKGEWSRAVNVGRPINTPYDEISPFIHPSNRVLFFASNGHVGLGGLDIFYSERGDSTWQDPINMGKPINNFEDQFSFFVTADGTKGYYSHEDLHDKNGVARGRIYEMDIPVEKRVKYRSNYVKGLVLDKDTHDPLQASIELINLDKNKRESIVTSDSLTGSYLITLAQGAPYALYVTKEGYLFRSLHFNYSEVKDFEPIVMDIELERVKTGSETVLNNIFFDTDKYDLRDESTTELEKLIAFLNDNPKVSIEIDGHTDNVGADSYNLDLSQKRAMAVFNFLTTHGINPARLKAQGFGSTRPVADNDTEAGRQQNRRIAFKILKD